MAGKILYADFKAFFEENVARRSRTSKGISDISSSRVKQKLLKEGPDLEYQVKKNTDRLIDSVWEHRKLDPITPQRICFLDTWWNDIINFGLVPFGAYEEEYEELEKEGYKMNRRYRVWTPEYTTFKLAPHEIESSMSSFYQSLYENIERARRGALCQAGIIAYADFIVDSAIHPWVDGCGRSATALVMWLSLLVPGSRLPLFGARELHHKAIKDLSLHVAYVERCLTHEFK